MSVWDQTCMNMEWTKQVEEFSIDKAWIAGAFFLGLLIGGGITALIIPPCLRDWEKKKNASLFKKQDEEENILIANEEQPGRETPVKGMKSHDDDPEKGNVAKAGRFAAATGFFKRKKSGKKDQETEMKDTKGWVQPEDNNKRPGSATTGTNAVGIVTVLTKPNSGEADAELTKQDINEMDKLDEDQKNDKDDLLLKMLKMKLRKMKGKGQVGDPYLADFTQKVIDNRKGNKEMLDMEQQEAEDEIRLKHKKNKAAMDTEIDNLNIRMDAKRRQFDKDEIEKIRGDLLRTSGLSEAEIDDMIEKLKQDMAELERKQGIEQARQARHLAERLEKRRQMLEYRKFQEQQGREEGQEEVKAFEEPLQKLVDDGKLLDRQKKEILDEHEKNLQNLQKQHDIDAMRLQQDLAEKLRQRREGRMRKLEDKHQKEKASFLQKSEKSTNTTEFANNYQNLAEQQQQEVESVQTEIDQTEIMELEKLTQNLDSQKETSMKDMSDKMVQSVAQKGQLPDADVKRIIKLHDMQMTALENRRRDELEGMRARLQDRWQQRLKKMEHDEKRDVEEREAILEQQDNTVKKVLGSNLDLTDEAKDKILKEHERNMVSLNNQLSRSKAKQQVSLENKLSERRARLAAIKAEQDKLQAEKKDVSEKEMQKLQSRLDEEILLFEKDKKQAENDLRRRLALETEAALAQQEKELATLIGRLEVGHARRLAVLQQQDKTLKELQEQLEGKIDSGRLSANKADQIIQQHYNQVEYVNNNIQNNRERQEQIIQEKLQAKRFQKERELEDQIRQEEDELKMARRQAGTGMASAILNKSLMQQRHKKAMEDLEKEMQIELEKSREQLNAELQQSLEKELEAHKGQFLNNLAAASKQAPDSQEYGGRRSSSRGGYQEKSSLGLMEEDSEEEAYYSRRPSSNRPQSGTSRPQSGTSRPQSGMRVTSAHLRRDSNDSSTTSGTNRNFMKKKNTFGPQPPRKGFQTSTGEQVHGVWDLDDDTL